MVNYTVEHCPDCVLDPVVGICLHRRALCLLQSPDNPPPCAPDPDRAIARRDIERCGMHREATTMWLRQRDFEDWLNQHHPL